MSDANPTQLYDAIDETPGIAINIIRLLSRRIRELNSKVNVYEAKNPTPDFTKAGGNLVR